MVSIALRIAFRINFFITSSLEFCTIFNLLRDFAQILSDIHFCETFAREAGEVEYH